MNSRAWILAIAWFFSSLAARAEPCTGDQAARARFLQTTLTDTIRADKDWSLKWGLGWGALTVAQLAASPFVPTTDHKRDELYVGAIGSAAGLVPTLIVRARSLGYEDLASDSAASCAKLTALEKALESVAEEEELRRGWLSRIGGALFSTGLGLYLGLNYHHWASGGATIGFGILANEAMIRTSSDLAVRNLARYRGGDYATAEAESPSRLGFSLILDRGAAGLGLAISLN